MTGLSVSARGVCRVYETGGQRVEALRSVDLDLERGEAVAIVGGSGSGKSTLLGLLGAMDLPSAGSIAMDGVDIVRIGARERARYRRRVGFVFQAYNLLPGLSALENVLAPIAPFVRAREARRRAAHLLARVGLEGRERSVPGELSGGQQQRVAIARALVGRPALLLADEPTGNLDPASGGTILELLHEVQVEEATTLVLVTHDTAATARCSRVLRLENGAVEATSAPRDSRPPLEMG